jgi:hypothetical protein
MIAAWGRGLMYASLPPLPLDRLLIARPKRTQQSLAGAPDTPLAARAPAPPHAIGQNSNRTT